MAKTQKYTKHDANTTRFAGSIVSTTTRKSTKKKDNCSQIVSKEEIVKHAICLEIQCEENGVPKEKTKPLFKKIYNWLAWGQSSKKISEIIRQVIGLLKEYIGNDS